MEQEFDDKINIDASAQKTDSEFQKFITDASGLQLSFYCAFSGWRIHRKPIISEILGIKKTEYQEDIIIDIYSRCLNEYGASFLFNSIYPLISQLVATSKLTDSEIYTMWTAKVVKIRWTLLKNYAAGNNYEINLSRISDITTTILELYAITAKAKNGFTLTELAESFITSVINKNGNIENNTSSKLDKITSYFQK